MNLKGFQKWLKKHNPVLSIRKQLPDFVTGLLLSSLLGFLGWLLAYFGYINLGLPSHFDYQIINKQIQAAFPEGYTYKTSTVNNFRSPNSETLLVIGHALQFNKNNAAFKSSDQNLSDIVILFDKTAKGYQKSYIFRPLQHSSQEGVGYEALITSPYYSDTNHINQEGKTDIILGWIYIHASASEPIPLIFSDHQGRVVVNSIDPSKPPFHQRDNILTVSNFYDLHQTTSVDAVDGFYSNKSHIAFRVIQDLLCKACTNQNTYLLLYYDDVGDKLTYSYTDPTLFKGLSSVGKALSSKGYKVDQ